MAITKLAYVTLIEENQDLRKRLNQCYRDAQQALRSAQKSGYPDEMDTFQNIRNRLWQIIKTCTQTKHDDDAAPDGLDHRPHYR